MNDLPLFFEIFLLRVFMKRFVQCALGAIIAFSFVFAAAGCGDDSDPTVLETIDSADIKSYPMLFVDGSDSGYTDASIGTDTLVYTCAADADVTVRLEGEAATISSPEISESGGVKTVTYTLTAVSEGDYTLAFYDGDAKDGQISCSVRPAYPEDPEFDAFNSNFNSDPSTWGTMNGHDPSMIEVNGTYYAFSTGNNGQPGYEIRKSEDLIHWTYVGQAFSNVSSALRSVASQLEEVYGQEITPGDLWAPDIVPAHGSGFWLYGCLTAAFGNNFSVIFRAYSDTIEGGFSYREILVVSGGNWATTANAIDPQIYWDAEGGMYMVYGSFQGGFRTLELDPETGGREDGYTYDMYQDGDVTSDAYYGGKLTYTSNAEGPVVAYKEDVALYTKDIFSEPYDADAWTSENYYYLMGSADSLSADYNMRYWRSDAPTSGFTTGLGEKVSSSFSWRYDSSDTRIGYNFFAPGHNDMYTTPDGVDLLVYHNRTGNNPQDMNWPHYLFDSMYALDSNGEIVMSPNRYAGEALRKITEDELTKLSSGNYDYIALGLSSTSIVYASEGLRLEEDGTLTIDGTERGEWILYGDYYVAFTIDETRYYGVAMPAWIEAENRGGITISARSEDAGLPFFMNMAF